MINSLKSFVTVLESTSLRDRNIAQVDVLDGNETVFAVDVSGEDVLSVWNIGRNLLDKTGRWPVISTFWTQDGDDWKEKVEEADFFSRFYFEEAPNISDVSPQGLIKLAETADPNFLLSELSNQNNEYLTIDDVLDSEIQDSFFRYGEKPTEEQIKQAKIHGKPIKTARDLDYWLFEWESNLSGNGKPEEARQDWFTQEPIVLLFLPTRNSWDTLAYINWFGTSDFGSQYYIALLKSWFERFDAELVAHYGTMLQFNVSKPPKTRKEAWGLANEHELVAPCTLALPGISLRHHALGLINYNRWFLDERP